MPQPSCLNSIDEEYQLLKKRLCRPKLRADVKNLELCVFSEAKTVDLRWTDLGLAFSWPIWGPRLNGSKTKICENWILRHRESWDWYKSLENLKPVLQFYQLQKCLYIYIIRHDRIQDVYYQKRTVEAVTVAYILAYTDMHIWSCYFISVWDVFLHVWEISFLQCCYL